MQIGHSRLRIARTGRKSLVQPVPRAFSVIAGGSDCWRLVRLQAGLCGQARSLSATCMLTCAPLQQWPAAAAVTCICTQIPCNAKGAQRSAVPRRPAFRRRNVAGQTWCRTTEECVSDHPSCPSAHASLHHPIRASLSATLLPTSPMMGQAGLSYALARRLAV